MASVERCRECDGTRVEGEHCLAHLSADELDRHADRLAAGAPLVGRGATFTSEALARLLERLTDQGRPRVPQCDFGEARFLEDASWQRAKFLGDASFNRAVFEGHASFSGAEFGGRADFSATNFRQLAGFLDAQFAGEAAFISAEIGGFGNFSARYRDTANFNLAKFHGMAMFSQAEFSAEVYFSSLLCSRELWLLEATFREPVTLGALAVAETMILNRASFEQGLRVDLSASVLHCAGTRFGGRADLNVRWAEIAFDEAMFLGPSRLAGVAAFPEFDDEVVQSARLERTPDAQAQPRLLSVRSADVANLSIANTDLRACRFFGAHGLEEVVIEADCLFARPPPRWRYTPRRTLAEEHEWRALQAGRARDRERRGSSRERSSRSGWYPPQCRPSTWMLDWARTRKQFEPEAIDPPRISPLYRALRKGLEDRKDEPGAADFYYGEMEMRRKDPHGPIGERTILFLYWLVAGYGLRASRALAALIATIAIFAVLLWLFGFDPRPGFARALVFSIESTSSLFRAPELKETSLTYGGEVLQIVLRLLGPLFFGLLLLSLRGRVKR